MINVIVPITEKFEEYKKMVESLSKRKGVALYLGIDEKFKDEKLEVKKAVVKYYKTKSAKEEIINSLHTLKKSAGSIMVVRRPITDEEFERLTSASEDIVILNREKNKFAKWWKDIWKKLLRMIFGFFYFDDISAVYFKDRNFNLISSLTNLSYISRINRFVGLSIGEVSTTQKSTKKDFDRFTAIVNFLSFFLLLAICVLVSVIICTGFGVNIVNVLLSFALTLFGFVFFLVAILNLARTVAVGRLRFGRAEEII